MADSTVLYVTGESTDALGLVKRIQYNKTVSNFKGTGDNTLALYKGKAGLVTGTVYVEDMTTAETIQAAAVIASAAFTCANGAGGTTTITISNYPIVCSTSYIIRSCKCTNVTRVCTTC